MSLTAPSVVGIRTPPARRPASSWSRSTNASASSSGRGTRIVSRRGGSGGEIVVVPVQDHYGHPLLPESARDRQPLAPGARDDRGRCVRGRAHGPPPRRAAPTSALRTSGASGAHAPRGGGRRGDGRGSGYARLRRRRPDPHAPAIAPTASCSGRGLRGSRRSAGPHRSPSEGLRPQHQAGREARVALVEGGLDEERASGEHARVVGRERHAVELQHVERSRPRAAQRARNRGRA